MVCPDGSTNASGDNTAEALADGRLKRSELQRNAANICEYVMQTQAMKRKIGEETTVTVINRPAEPDDVDLSEVEFIELDGDMTIALDTKDSKAGVNYVFPFDVKKKGRLRNPADRKLRTWRAGADAMYAVLYEYTDSDVYVPWNRRRKYGYFKRI